MTNNDKILRADELNELFDLTSTKDKTAKSYKNLEWQSLVDLCWAGEYEIRPLTSTADLIAEGEAMFHCVGIFDHKCYRGEYRIFSIIGYDGRRIATLSIRYVIDRWIFDQCFGYANAVVCSEEYPVDIPSEEWKIGQPTDIHFLAMDIVCRYNRAYFK